MLIEKPLATDLAESARVLKAITDAKLDAVVGYTSASAASGSAPREGAHRRTRHVTLVTSRAFMNACRDRQLQAHRLIRPRSRQW